LHTLDIGKAEILKEGNDLAILAIGHAVQATLEAAQNVVEDQGISAAIVNARFIKPLDADLILALARRIGKMITVEEHVLQGGFGSAVLELLQAHDIRIPVRCVGLPDHYIEHGSQSTLRHKYGLDAEGIEKVILEMGSKR
jgi:1-deoxy-D-xylulose-5-phosphate synthase